MTERSRTSPRPTVARLVLAVVLLLTAVAGCSNSDDGADTSAPGTVADRGFVGEVEGTDAYIAVVPGPIEAVAYVCDGDADIAEWFRGPVDDGGRLTLTSDNGATLDAVIGRGVTGTVRLADGTVHDFSAATVDADSGAGLYRIADGDSAGVVGGWVAGLDGTARGSLRVRGVRKTAAAQPSATVEVEGTTFEVVALVITPQSPGPVPVPYPTHDGGDTTTTRRTIATKPSN